MADQPIRVPGSMLELLDLIPRADLLPGEDVNAYAGLRQGLLADLAPASPYESAIAESIVELEWEAYRYRQIRNNILRQRCLELASGVFLGQGLEVPVPSCLEAPKTARDLLGSDPIARARAREDLQEYGIDEGALLARAYQIAHTALMPIERHISGFEPRRRRLKNDYDKLRTSRANSVSEAEIVSVDGD